MTKISPATMSAGIVMVVMAAWMPRGVAEVVSGVAAALGAASAMGKPDVVGMVWRGTSVVTLGVTWAWEC